MAHPADEPAGLGLGRLGQRRVERGALHVAVCRPALLGPSHRILATSEIGEGHKDDLPPSHKYLGRPSQLLVPFRESWARSMASFGKRDVRLVFPAESKSNLAYDRDA